MIVEYVRSLYGVYSGVLFLSNTIAAEELTAPEAEALVLEASAMGIRIEFSDVENEWEETE